MTDRRHEKIIGGDDGGGREGQPVRKGGHLLRPSGTAQGLINEWPDKQTRLRREDV